MKLGTRVIIGDEEVQLQWGDRRFIKTIKLSKANNIPIMQSAPGFHRFKAFTAKINHHIACFDTHIIPDNESMIQGEHIPEELGDPNWSDSIQGDPRTLNN
jgi:hypothetical protein